MVQMAMIREKDCFFFSADCFASYPSGQKWAKQYTLVNLKTKNRIRQKNDHNIAMPS